MHGCWISAVLENPTVGSKLLRRVVPAVQSGGRDRSGGRDLYPPTSTEPRVVRLRPPDGAFGRRRQLVTARLPLGGGLRGSQALPLGFSWSPPPFPSFPPPTLTKKYPFLDTPNNKIIPERDISDLSLKSGGMSWRSCDWSLGSASIFGSTLQRDIYVLQWLVLHYGLQI